jgi:hypothetical protein
MEKWMSFTTPMDKAETTEPNLTAMDQEIQEHQEYNYTRPSYRTTNMWHMAMTLEKTIIGPRRHAVFLAGPGCPLYVDLRTRVYVDGYFRI